MEVLTYDKDRGEVSRKRGENAGVKSVGSMAELVQNAELIVSIVVPSAATRVAAKVAEAVKTAGRKDLLFLDANAISPMTADEIAEDLASRGREFCRRLHYWFGSQNGKGNDRLCFRSSRRAGCKLWKTFKIPIKVLGANTNQASAFKVVYAGLTKGLQGLFCELLMGARRFGLLEEIRAQYEESFPGLLDKVSRALSSACRFTPAGAPRRWTS